MNSEQMIMILSKLALGSVAAFLSIILWSKTRDTAWMFVIIGILLTYGEIIFQTLKAFGIIGQFLVFSGVPVFELLLVNLPLLFFITAFLFMILRRAVK
jgi:hypothetical protein